MFQQWSETWAREALRVLKPGGHLLAFGGTRTFHRMTIAIEDAGFEIRDCLMWLYGQGFPKSLDVSRAIDKAKGAEREVVGPNRWQHIMGQRPKDDTTQVYGRGQTDNRWDTAPATDLARKWQGWGTALKPAWEPIILARKPLAGTVAQNVERHGTGALNIDGCRIATSDNLNGGAYSPETDAGRIRRWEGGEFKRKPGEFSQPEGRWPANVVLDEDAAAMLDDQSGEHPSGKMHAFYSPGREAPVRTVTGRSRAGYMVSETYGDTGGASRFFYTAKADKQDRGKGNTHPTVKPVDLMRWLCRLVTPPGGLVLDPFAGSGTTGQAALAEGFRCILIEKEAEYVAGIEKWRAAMQLGMAL